MFIYAIKNSVCSPPDIQLIFAKLSLTAELKFNRAGTEGEVREDEKEEKRQRMVSKGQSRSKPWRG